MSVVDETRLFMIGKIKDLLAQSKERQKEEREAERTYRDAERRTRDVEDSIEAMCLALDSTGESEWPRLNGAVTDVVKRCGRARDDRKGKRMMEAMDT